MDQNLALYAAVGQMAEQLSTRLAAQRGRHAPAHRFFVVPCLLVVGGMKQFGVGRPVVRAMVGGELVPEIGKVVSTSTRVERNGRCKPRPAPVPGAGMRPVPVAGAGRVRLPTAVS
jgi:hypothetical protein